jgi:drug/metabolite transporter (DMT)-like permease
MSKTFFSVLAGISAMLGWGVSDFFASQSSDKVGHFKTVFYSQITGVLVILIAAICLSTSFNMPLSLLPVLLVCGVSYAFGYILFYKGFELGNISVVSAVITLQTVFIIAISYFLSGQRLTPLQVPGILMAIVGVLLVSVNINDVKSAGPSISKGVKETLLAALLFGVLYWPTNEYIVERIDWIAATLYIKIIAIITLIVIAIVSREKIRIPKNLMHSRMYTIIALTGALEAVGVLSIGLGGAYGDYIIVAPIAGSLTIVTVSLAVIFLKEKISKQQGLGIVLTVLGILITGL